jgi:hypothetical protein
MCTITTVSLDHVVTTVNLDAVFAFVAIVGSVIPLVALMMHSPSCHQLLCVSALVKCLKTQQNGFFFMFGMDVMPLDATTFFFPLEGGVGLVPKRGCLLTLAYYALPR